MDRRNRPRLHHGLLAALTLWGCVHREPVSPGDLTRTREEFDRAVFAAFELDHQFDGSTAELRDEDRLDEVSRKLECRGRNQHLERIGSLLGSAGFERAFDGKPGPCWTWGRSQDRESFLATRGWAGAKLPTQVFHVVRDVVRVCVELRPEDDKCVTTYRPYAVRLLQAKPEGGYVRLVSPELANDLGKETVEMSRDGIEHWVAEDR